MARIGEILPQDDRHDLVATIRPGAILHLFCPFIMPPKDKFFVLAALPAATPQLLMFFINSRVPSFIQNNPALCSSQVPVLKSDYGFLDHDSYIDCNTVVDNFDYGDIKTQLTANMVNLKGELSTATRRQIITALQQHPTITAEQERLITEALA